MGKMDGGGEECLPHEPHHKVALLGSRNRALVFLSKSIVGYSLRGCSFLGNSRHIGTMVSQEQFSVESHRCKLFVAVLITDGDVCSG